MNEFLLPEKEIKSFLYLFLYINSLHLSLYISPPSSIKTDLMIIYNKRYNLKKRVGFMFNRTAFKKRILFVGIPDMAYIGIDGLLMAGVNIVGVLGPKKDHNMYNDFKNR